MDRRACVALSVSIGLPLAIVTGSCSRASETGGQVDAKSAKSVIAPELDRCTLNVEGHAFKPIRVSSANLADHRVGNLRIKLEGASLAAFPLGEQKPQWRVTAPDAANLVWLAADYKVIYLAAYRGER